MSGHSHWATVKHRKGAADAKKGKVFSKLARYIMIAAKQGGSDPNMNIKLLYAIEKARAANMPKDNIERAIKKGAGELAGVTFEEFVYEGYGPGGVAIMVEILTDNRNRTNHEIRRIFENNGATPGAANSVSWLFERKGLITIPQNAVAEDQIIADALDVGADDVEPSSDVYEITCSPTNFEKIKNSLQAKYSIRSSELTLIPKNYIKVDEAIGKKLLTLMDELEEHEDTQNVYSNFDLPQTLLVENT